MVREGLDFAEQGSWLKQVRFSVFFYFSQGCLGDRSQLRTNAESDGTVGDAALFVMFSF